MFLVDQPLDHRRRLLGDLLVVGRVAREVEIGRLEQQRLRLAAVVAPAHDDHSIGDGHVRQRRPRGAERAEPGRVRHAGQIERVDEVGFAGRLEPVAKGRRGRADQAELLGSDRGGMRGDVVRDRFHREPSGRGTITNHLGLHLSPARRQDARDERHWRRVRGRPGARRNRERAGSRRGAAASRPRRR